MLNSLHAKLLAGLVAAGGAYYIAPPALLAKIGIEKPFKVENFEIADLTGRRVELSNCGGRPVLLYIWTTTCPASLENLAMIEVLYEKYRYTQLCFLPIARDRDESARDDALPKLKAFAEQHHIPYPVYKGWGYLPAEVVPKSIPHAYLIDRNGVMKKGYALLPDHRGKLEKDLSAMLYDGSPESRISISEPLSIELVREKGDEDRLVSATKYHLDREEFGQLEAIARELRATKARFKRGRWKLPLFYSALKDFPEGTTWEQRLQLFQKWAAAMPDSVTARVAAADILVSAAWLARGGGYSSEVSADNRRLFEGRLVSARTILEEAEKLPESCPALYNSLLLVAQGQGWARAEYENLFRKAVALEPLYTDHYTRKAFYLLPQWYGKTGEWEKFAETSAEAVKDSVGMDLYARIAWNMGEMYGKRGIDLFRKTALSWPRMRQGFIDADKRYPDSVIMLNVFAWYACVAGDKETAKGLFARLGDRYDPAAWGNPLQYHKWRRWANEADSENVLKKLAKVFAF
ncbi:MAG: hypothetical protein FD189_197 [Elusimicrobia bacterium]|nr:MAG: hypothetical protein FD154_349 [Elusimicrobiota bacterium]KAF0158205.1 MAG: hypothetical protein FD189_197 [Elusimicrobiota bacterium]